MDGGETGRDASRLEDLMYEEIAREGNKKVEFGAAQGGGAESEDARQNRKDGGGGQ
jgi:hypothetical protein